MQRIVRSDPGPGGGGDGDVLESLSKAHVPPHAVDKVYEDLIQEIHERYATHVAPEVRTGLEVERAVVSGVPSLEIIHAASAA